MISCKRIKKSARITPRGYSGNSLFECTVNPCAGWREIGGKRVYFRSRMESNYARYLEWLKKMDEIQRWEHEKVTFWFDGIRRGCVSYLPDFEIQNKNGLLEYHEVKGWMDSKSKTKIKRMTKYHPKVNLIVIGKKEYQSIKKKMSRIISGWE